MNSLNPFVPSVPLIRVPTRNPRNWFRKAVFGVLIIHAGVILALLFVHGRSEAASPGVALTVRTPVNPKLLARPAAAPVPALPTVAPAPAPTSAVQPTGVYVVRSGDTLSSIARLSNCSTKALKSANGLANERLMVGQKLKLPENRLQMASLSH